MYDDWIPLLPPIVTSEQLRKTGLLDADGDPFYKQPNPIGFGRDKEWKPRYLLLKS